MTRTRQLTVGLTADYFAAIFETVANRQNRQILACTDGSKLVAICAVGARAEGEQEGLNIIDRALYPDRIVHYLITADATSQREWCCIQRISATEVAVDDRLEVTATASVVTSNWWARGEWDIEPDSVLLPAIDAAIEWAATRSNRHPAYVAQSDAPPLAQAYEEIVRERTSHLAVQRARMSEAQRLERLMAQALKHRAGFDEQLQDLSRRLEMIGIEGPDLLPEEVQFRGNVYAYTTEEIRRFEGVVEWLEDVQRQGSQPVDSRHVQADDVHAASSGPLSVDALREAREMLAGRFNS